MRISGLLISMSIRLRRGRGSHAQERIVDALTPLHDVVLAELPGHDRNNHAGNVQESGS